jgi:hypothetical protein
MASAALPGSRPIGRMNSNFGRSVTREACGWPNPDERIGTGDWQIGHGGSYKRQLHIRFVTMDRRSGKYNHGCETSTPYPEIWMGFGGR